MRTLLNYLNRKGVVALLCTLGVGSVKADCTYDQALSSEEFDIGLMLTWSTSNETNNSMFIVEKSEDGEEFLTIGNIKGGGTLSKLKNYNFLDPQASGKKIYYRLKQVDADGTFSYSEILTVSKKKQNNVSIVQMSSETSSKSFDFTVDALIEGGAVLKLVDNKGQVVWQGVKHLRSGLNNVSVDLTAQAEGVYKVVLLMDKDEKSLTIRRSLDEVERRTNVASERKATGRN